MFTSDPFNDARHRIDFPSRFEYSASRCDRHSRKSQNNTRICESSNVKSCTSTDC